MFSIGYQIGDDIPTVSAQKYNAYNMLCFMDGAYHQVKHDVLMGHCTTVIVDLIPVDKYAGFILTSTNMDSVHFPGYVIVGITTRYRGFNFTEHKYIVKQS